MRGVNADRAFEIVGVVENVSTNGLRAAIPDEIYFPFDQLPRPTPAIVARTDGDPDQLSRVFTTAVAELDPALPIARFASMDDRIRLSLGPDRTLALLGSAFAFVAAFLAALGLYAVLAHGVAARRVEIGIRMAIGASRRSIVRLIVLQASRLAGMGLALGLVAAAFAARTLQAQLFGVSAHDFWIFAAVTAGFGVMSLAAAWLPARRASRVDPLSALAGR
jgi:predicted lysophospholipase L1 biosynthesis ABC-type transport system permease subunit